MFMTGWTHQPIYIPCSTLEIYNCRNQTSVRLCPVLGVTLVLRDSWACDKAPELKLMLEEKTVNGGSTLLFFLLKNNLFLATLGLPCCTWTFSSCRAWGLPFVVVHGLFIAVSSLVEQRLESMGLQQLQHAGSGAVTSFNCSVASGLFPDRGLNTGPLY